MSFVFGWFWSDKPVDEKEANREVANQRALFKELKEVFQECDLAEHAERKYDYDTVYDLLSEILGRVEKTYQGASFSGGHWVFPTEVERLACKRMSEEYLDAIVKHKMFLEDHEILKIAIAKKIFSYADFEQFHFDWHYWQLFRRNLQDDLKNQTEALQLIEHHDDSTSTDADDADADSWDTDEEE